MRCDPFPPISDGCCAGFCAAFADVASEIASVKRWFPARIAQLYDTARCSVDLKPAELGLVPSLVGDVPLRKVIADGHSGLATTDRYVRDLNSQAVVEVMKGRTWGTR